MSLFHDVKNYFLEPQRLNFGTVVHVEPHQHHQQSVLSKVTMVYMFVE
jgi:hypothetical protein